MLENMPNNESPKIQLTPSEKLRAKLEADKLEFLEEVDKAFESLIAVAPIESGAKLVSTESADHFYNLTEEANKREINHKEKYIIFTYVTPEGKYLRKKYSFSGKEGKWSVAE